LIARLQQQQQEAAMQSMADATLYAADMRTLSSGWALLATATTKSQRF
jgi:hypothetical protein